MKLFISQAMHGRTLEKIKKEREEYVEAFKDKLPYKDGDTELEVINNLQEDYDPGECNNPRLAYLGNSINAMKDADYVMFVADCIATSNGCKVEFEICKLYNIPYSVYNIRIDRDRIF